MICKSALDDKVDVIISTNKNVMNEIQNKKFELLKEIIEKIARLPNDQKNSDIVTDSIKSFYKIW